MLTEGARVVGALVVGELVGVLVVGELVGVLVVGELVVGEWVMHPSKGTVRPPLQPVLAATAKVYSM